MERSSVLRLGAVLCITIGGCAEGATGPDTDRRRAEVAVDAWIAEHPEGFSADGVSKRTAVRPEWSPPCSSPLTKGTVSLRVSTTAGDLEFSFVCPVSDQSTTDELEVRLIGVTPWNLTSGIRVPDWTFRTLLPLITVQGGTSFTRVSPGLLAVHVRTTMLGIGATRAGCAYDAGTALRVGASCAFVREHAIPLDLHFTLPADLSALR